MAINTKKFLFDHFTVLSILTFIVLIFGLTVILVIKPLVLYAFMASILLFGVGLLFLKKPLWALYAFILLLPFHSLLLTILIAQLNLPIPLVKAIAGWKEMLLVGTAIIMLVHVFVQKRSTPIVWVDWAAWLWFGLIVFYFLFHDVLFDWTSSLTLRFYGIRDWLLYLLPYLIGRAVIVSDTQARKILDTILWIGVLTSTLGIIEYFFVPTEFHIQLGVPRYFSEFLNLSYPDYLSGLPPNYWTSISDHVIRRAVSTYLSGQGFAVPFLIVIPVVTYYYLGSPTKSRLFLLLICWFALLLTITRMTIVVCFLQSLVLLLLLGKTKKLFSIIIITSLISSMVVFSNSSLRNYVIHTVTFQDDSGRTRPGQWLTGLTNLFEHPLGFGLGSTGQVGARFGQSGIGTEAGYFKLTGALGLPGLLLFFSWFLGVLLSTFYVYKRFYNSRGEIAGVTFIVAIGFLLNNITAPPDQSTFVIYIFGWLAGLSVQQITLLSTQRQSIAFLRIASPK